MVDPTCELTAAIEELETAVHAVKAEIARRQRARQRWRVLANVVTSSVVAAAGVGAIAAAPVPSRIKAPFTVVGANGTKILQVSSAPRGFQLFNEAGRPTVVGIASVPATFIKASSPDGNTQAVLGIAEDKTPSFLLRAGGPQKTRLALAVVDNKPELNLNNAAGLGVLLLGEMSGSGVLQLSAADGNARVGAGITPGGVGAVQTFPNGNSGRTFFGLPGTYICGVGCGK